ncbi:type II 3-dehydroquinate dehydratase [Glutamicibacter soli]|uniref:3-dehydroquinate dehydratase n=1 Tax=Glutamicibacter soli TaxID=453836 RepID=A0A365YDJ0_9MICC|nr:MULTISPECIES: type II 3-dehydroquinate dehydratase [Micrococcaceae]ALD64663.1 3-dehydroquinate dehydratase [Arthrobacter sp. LS16]ALQ29994.1 3-dehydroquinate dehydratase [Arthrobacter sp. YC-RL1]KLI88669.1 3-dehydroquinate dehydratase [Arthrobacter sp. YC-RL1]RBM00619.1 type II 3-dehydroquinate dehydratase [Glutamicibacter soli]RKS22139.1 3-dehydroquinate dehydratase [Arthrobacter sp. AG1021]
MTENASRTILLLNGPNLNLLGTREPEIYGRETLADVEALARSTAQSLGFELTAVQSNHEGVLLDAIHEARTTAAGIVINPGAFTHTSIALADAISGVELPAIEVHISNVHKREAFRHHSYISPVASSIIIGAGVNGYRLAVEQMAHLLGK